MLSWFLASAGCGEWKGGAGTTDDDVGTIVFQLTTVPSDARCLRVVVDAGSENVVRTFDVAPNQPANVSATALPLGLVTVTEQVFNSACSAVTTASLPTWVSQAPVMATLVSGQSTSITITLRRPGGVSITNDFQEGNGIISISTPAVAFGSVALGQTSAPVLVTVTNLSMAAVVAISEIVGTNAGDFAFSSDCGTSVSAGGSCTIGVSFRPLTAGPRAANLNVGSPLAGIVALSGTGTGTGSVTVSPSPGNFGTLALSQGGGSINFTVTNTTGAAVNAVPSLTGANAAELSLVTTTCGTTLAAGTTCTVTVRHTPTAVGIKTASLVVGSPAVVTVPVNSTVVTETGLDVVPATVSFGTVSVGQTSPAQTLTVTNQRATGAVAISEIVGANAGDFAFSSSCGTSVSAGGSCLVSVTFRPLTAGPRAANLNVGSPLAAIVALAGTGTGTGSVTVSPSPGNFGTLALSQGGVSINFTVTNTTGAAVNAVPSLTGTNAAELSLVTTNCGTTLAAGTTCTVTVRHTPTAVGIKTASLVVGSPAVVTVPVNSTVVTETGLDVVPATVSFGTVSVGQTSPAQTLTVTNQRATGAVAISEILGANAGDFACSSSCGTSVSAGGSCLVSVTFRPLTAGPRTANLNVGSPLAAIVALSGTGTGTGANWTSLDVGAVAATGSFTQTGSVLTLNGSGADVYGTADEFRYAFQSIVGDATITARLVSLQNTNGIAKAGLMVRDGTAANARYVAVLGTPTASNGYRTQARTAAGGGTSNPNPASGAGTLPVWLRLSRAGNNFTVSTSTNGTTWTALGLAINLALPTTLSFGLFVTSHADGTLAAASFDDVSINSP